MADQLFRQLEELAQCGETTLLDQLLDTFAEEAQVAYCWGRLLKTGSRVPQIFATRLFELLTAKPILEYADTLEAVGTFLEQTSQEMTAAQRQEIETRILNLAEEASDEKQRNRFVLWRDRLIARIPPSLLTTDKAMAVRVDLEQQRAIPSNEPLVRFSSTSGEYATEMWLREQGADLARQENKALLDACAPIERFTSDWRNKRPTPEAIDSILPKLETALRIVIAEDQNADRATIHLAWTRLAAGAAMVARGDLDLNAKTYEIPKKILLTAPSVDPPTDQIDHDETYTSGAWSSSPASEAAEGLPWLARLKADTEVTDAIMALVHDPRPWVRFLVVGESFRMIETSPEAFWALVRERAKNDRNVVVQDVLCRTVGRILPSHEAEVGSVLSVIAERVVVPDRDSDVLKSLIPIMMWLVLERGNEWASKFSNGFIENPTKFSYALSHAAFQVVHYIQPANIGTKHDVTLNRAVAWLSRAIATAVEGIKGVRAAIKDEWDKDSADLIKRLYGVMDQTVMRLHFALDSKYGSSQQNVPKGTDAQRSDFYTRIKPLLEQIADFAKDQQHGLLFAPTAHHFMEFLQQALPYNPAGTLKLAANVASASERYGYHLDSMAASETVQLAERLLADYRSILRSPDALTDLVTLLDLFATAGWPGALALLWRLDEIFR